MPAIEFKQKPIGEVTCSDCGWEHATVRPNKTGMLWWHCDSCRTQHQTRDTKGSDGLRAKMRPLTAGPAPQPEVTTVTKPKAKPKAKSDGKQLPPRRTGTKKEKQEAPPEKNKPGGDLWNDDFLGIGIGRGDK